MEWVSISSGNSAPRRRRRQLSAYRGPPLDLLGAHRRCSTAFNPDGLTSSPMHNKARGHPRSEPQSRTATQPAEHFRSQHWGRSYPRQTVTIRECKPLGHPVLRKIRPHEKTAVSVNPAGAHCPQQLRLPQETRSNGRTCSECRNPRAGYPPAQEIPASALVGLLTSASEVPAFSSRESSQQRLIPYDNGRQKGGTSHMHGHSGGAVPDLHRCSLFVGYPGRISDHQRSLPHKTCTHYAICSLAVKARAPRAYSAASPGETGFSRGKPAASPANLIAGGILPFTSKVLGRAKTQKNEPKASFSPKKDRQASFYLAREPLLPEASKRESSPKPEGLPKIRMLLRPSGQISHSAG